MTEPAFESFVASRWRPLMRAAWLLTGDWASAEDLVQNTLTRAWGAWHQVSAADEPDAYVRRMLSNEFLSGRRRKMSGEVPRGELPEPAGAESSDDDVVRRLVLDRALAALPPVQRAVVVLRFFLDLSVDQTAQALDCSVGNVKSQSSRALAKLRASSDLDQLMEATI